jgi:chromosome segregation ATPase
MPQEREQDDLKDNSVTETDPQHPESKSAQLENVRAALDVLWERARRVSSVVIRLRDENETNRARLKEIEATSRDAISEREKLIVQLAQMETKTNTAEGELKELRVRCQQLEESETNVRRILDETTVLLEQTRRDLAGVQANGTGPFTKEEKEAVRKKVRELIDKISARL